MRKSLVFIILFCSFYYHSFSQAAGIDSVSENPSLKNIVSLYYRSTGENSHLNNGSEYAGYDVNFIGNPFFDTTAMQPGSVYYDGTLYENLPILFDICNDAVIINRYNQDFRIRLVNEKIGYFSLLSHTFVRIVPDSASRLVIGIGFYDRVYKGKMEVLVRRKKIIKDDPVVNGEIKSRYKAVENYFIKRNNAYFPVRTEKSVVRLFKDRDKEIRRYIKKNKLSFKKQPEYAIIQVARYYDQLTN